MKFLVLWLLNLSQFLLFFNKENFHLSSASPSEEMEKFINECYVMIETMENCASGWVELEQEIINSIDSFSDRIIYTESLIMEEATLILDMADRIVETEAIMIDLIESCNCSEKQQIKQINKKSKLLINSTSNIIHVGQSTMSTPLRPVTVVENSTLSNDCAAMDYAIEVMDACIQTFEVYNDDFLEVLSYMVLANLLLRPLSLLELGDSRYG